MNREELLAWLEDDGVQADTADDARARALLAFDGELDQELLMAALSASRTRGWESAMDAETWGA